MLTQFRHQLLPLKDMYYLNWFRLNHEGYDPHHIMGSTFGMKFTDYLLVKADRVMHTKWQKDLPFYFPMLLLPAVENLLIYAEEQEYITGWEYKFYKKHHSDPLILNMLLEKIQGRNYVSYQPKKSEGVGEQDFPLSTL